MTVLVSLCTALSSSYMARGLRHLAVKRTLTWPVDSYCSRLSFIHIKNSFFHQQFSIPYATQISVVLQVPSKEAEARGGRQRAFCPQASAAGWQHLLKPYFLADHLFLKD